MAAQEYADQHFIERVVTGAPWPEAKKAYAKAFADGADFALKHQLIRTLDQMPEDGELVIVLAHGTGLVVSPKFNSKTGDRIGYFWRWSQRTDKIDNKTYRTFEAALSAGISVVLEPFKEYFNGKN